MLFRSHARYTPTSSETLDVFDSVTEEVMATIPSGSPADVDAAVQAAKQAFETWKDVSVTRRARVMFAFRELVNEHMDELARIISSEHGKTFEDAKGEVIRGMEVVEFACGIGRASCRERV